jgi:hypothetical protein
MTLTDHGRSRLCLTPQTASKKKPAARVRRNGLLSFFHKNGRQRPAGEREQLLIR